MDIRKAIPGDAPRISELLSQLGYRVPATVVADRIVACTDDRVVLVAAGPRGVAGVVEVEIRELLLDSFAEITALVVDASERGNGVGRALAAEVAELAGRRGAPAVRVQSNVVRSGAHAFYLRVGFERLKTQHSFRRQLDSPRAP